jgi:hypothetical protein
MARMILALKPPPGTRARLDRLLADLGDPRSPRFHQWLTPDQFGAEFGPALGDLDRVTAWLQDQGFTVQEVAAGRLSVAFSGTVAQVERAFRTAIRTFEVDGRVRQGNTLAPSIPRDLGDVVAGVVSLHNLPRQAQNTGFRPLPRTIRGAPAQHHLTPGDFAAIYAAGPLHRQGLDGTGVSIAVVGRSRIRPRDVAEFRRAYGLPPRAPEILVNGPDPGDLGGSDESEADLDVEWAGAAAPGATIRLVASASTASTDGVDLSARFAVDHNLAPVLSVSFGQCEQRLGAAEQVFYQDLWAQAAAQGITVLVSSGDAGAAGCDWGGQGSGSGRAVNGLASTPYNLAVGGTQFQEGKGCYWKDTPNPDGSSAFRYIPERAWNESAASPGGSGLWATGGGTSTLRPKPGWQRAPGVPANAPQYQFRCLPDLALAAAADHDGYLVRSGGRDLVTGGTSCSAPAMAGIMALVVQRTGQRQGNAGPALYRLGAAQYRGTGPVVFHDSTEGDNCVPGTQGYSCRPGYDLATGLGSVDAGALVAAWEAGQGANVDARILQPAGDRTVANGTAVAFRGEAGGTDPDAHLACGWDFGDGTTAQGLAAVHAYRNPGQVPITNRVTFTAADDTGARGSDARAITVLPAPAPGERITDGGFELGGGAWQARGVRLGDSTPDSRPHQGSGNAWFPPGRAAPEVLRQTVTLPAGSARALLSFWLRIDFPGRSEQIQAALQVKVRGGDGRLATLGTYTNLGGGLGYQPCAFRLDGYRGQTVELAFVAIHHPGDPGTSFSLDDVSLLAP